MIHLKTIISIAEETPMRVAIVADNKVMSWSKLQGETEGKIRFILTKFGKNLPSQACYLAHNRIELLPWLAAFATLGIPVTGIDYSLPKAQINELLNELGADFLLVSKPALTDGAPGAIGAPALVQHDIDSPAMADAGAPGGRLTGNMLAYLAETGFQPKPFRAASLTSGTSGKPKVAVRSRPFDKRRFAHFTNRYGFDSGDSFLLCMPLYHAAGNGWARLFMSIGATLHFSQIGDPADIARKIKKNRITASVMTPALINKVCDAYDGSDTPGGRSLKWVLVGGKNFPPGQKQKALNKFGPVIYEYYGTTETGVNTIAEPDDLAHHPASVGRAFDGNKVAIIDHAGRPLKAGMAGRVAISSYQNMDDYRGGGASTLEIEGERYILASEHGYLDRDGRLYLLNRCNSPGNHSNLYKLEDAIRRIEGVRDVALVSQSGDGNKEVNCFVELAVNPGASLNLTDKIRSLVNDERLRLTTLLEVPAIPYSPSGKVRDGDLSRYLANHGAS